MLLNLLILDKLHYQLLKLRKFQLFLSLQLLILELVLKIPSYGNYGNYFFIQIDNPTEVLIKRIPWDVA